MRKDTWRGNHHWIPEHGEWGKAHPRLWKAGYGDYKTLMEHDEHVEVQNETDEYGPIGARSRWERHKLEERSEELFGGGSSEYDDTDDEDY